MGVKTEKYEKIIGIREFSELLALDCINNNYSTDAGNTDNNIPLLNDEYLVTIKICIIFFHFPLS